MAINNLGRGVLGRGIHPEDIPAILAAAQQPTTQGPKEPAPTGSLADPPPGLVGGQGGAAYLLGKGMRSGGLGRGFSNFDRYAVNRGGKTLEAHDYGDGNIKYFARKNPAVLQAAVQQSLGQGRPGAPAVPDFANNRDDELLKLLLGNPTLR